MLTLILSVTISIVVSACCSLLESVLYSTRATTIAAEMEKGSAAAKAMHELKNRVDLPLSAILTLNTLANTAGAALAGWAAGRVLGSQSLWVFSLVFTLAILVFSEIVPKTVGAVYWRRLWQTVVWPIKAMVFVLWPFIILTQVVTRLITKGQHSTPLISEMEILAAASLGHTGGEISKMEADLIHNIIGLEEISASEIMTPRTVMVSINGAMRVSEILPQARQWSYSRLPVYMETPEDIVGYVLRDNILASDPSIEDPKLAQLARPLQFVPGSVNALVLLKHFLSRRQHMCIVVDEYGGVDGLVTMEDVLESLVGSEIVDETDQVVDMRELARRRGRAVMATNEEPEA